MGLPSEVRTYLKNGLMQKSILWDPALIAKAMLNVGVAISDGVEISDGMDLQITGYESIKVIGSQVFGYAGITLTKDNVDKFTF